MIDWKEIWERLARGEHAVTLGATRLVPPEPEQLKTLVVDCDLVNGPGRCLEEARRHVDTLVRDDSQALLGSTLAHVRWHVRRRLLGEPSGERGADRYRAIFARLRDTNPPTAIVFRAVDRADPTSLALLCEMLSEPLGIPIPVLFCFDAPPIGEARALLEALERSGHDVVASPEAAESPSSAPAAPADLVQQLPDATKAVMRAAATMGQWFESEVIATLLGMREIDVLAELQRAVDAGVPLEDRGAGRFRLDEDLVRELRRQTLPSLAHAWHRQLADVFGGPPQRPRATSPEPDAREVEAPSRPAVAPPRAPIEPSRDERRHPARPEQLFDVAPAIQQGRRDDEKAWADALAALTKRDPGQARPLAPTSPPAASPAGPHVDEFRAATHAEAVGDVVAAAENYLRGAERAASNGAHELALEYAERARLHLARRPADARGRGVRLRSLLLTARSRWLSLGRGRATTLESALEPLEAARSLLDECQAETLAEFASLYASICYDIGSNEALDAALGELAHAVKALLAREEPLLAAQLLNDEAAVWVRVGDPVRAHHLLERSRAIFSGSVASHPAASRELAETEHLMARLLLNARARAGREKDALQLGIEHALSAEEAYVGLGDRGQLARVWETLGRLEAALAHTERAAHYLQRAQTSQVQLGDATGLARSTAALADVFAAQGRHDRALDQLEDSVDLNLQKGSAVGLGFNLESLTRLRASLPDALQQQAEVLEAKLSALVGPRLAEAPHR